MHCVSYINIFEYERPCQLLCTATKSGKLSLQVLRRDSRRGAAPFANQLCVMRAECARGTRMRSDGIGFRDSLLKRPLLTLWTPHASLLFLAVTPLLCRRRCSSSTPLPTSWRWQHCAWLEECAAPYYIFTEAGLEVEMANILGGPSPIDAGSMGEGFFRRPHEVHARRHGVRHVLAP